jgi:hypothetical protein
LSSDNSKEFFNYIIRVITRIGEDQRNLSYLTENVIFLMNSVFYKAVKEWNNLRFKIKTVRL